MNKKEKLWTAPFVTNMGLNFAIYFSFYLLTIVIGSMSMTKMNASASLAGLLSGIFIFGGFFGRLWMGRNINRLGIKKAMVIGLAVYFIFSLAYYVVNDASILVIIRILHGIGFGMAATATGTFAGEIVPVSRRGEGIGYFALSITLSSALGPFLSMILYAKYGFSLILHLTVILSVLCVIAAALIKIPASIVLPVEKEKQPLTFSSLFELKAIPISIIGLLVGAAYSSILSFMNSYTVAIDLVSAGSIFFVVYAVAILVSRPLTGRLFDTKGDNFVMYPTFIFFALGLVLVGLAQSSWMLLLAAVSIGLGYGSFPPFAQAIAIREGGQDRVGVSTSTFFGFLDMGVGLGPILMGVIMPLVGYRMMFYLCAILVVLITIGYYFSHGKKH